ncbi:hypothetical protein [Halobacillus mangrovi]|uniref:Uncharacterized protein n=1 Tax=Halobacillus mangrovi TaxID=402384 RepID=A0A1W5ZS45_9BACI|nr:hypothetical protein [Halobacillus mangrovi]ARI76112.1 hypothetical protein HM131_04345 [Halobacillus mangrovi]
MSRINFNQLNIDQISNSSGVYSGMNAQSRYKAYQKHYEGNGKMAGDRNLLINNKHLIIRPPANQGD